MKKKRKNKNSNNIIGAIVITGMTLGFFYYILNETFANTNEISQAPSVQSYQNYQESNEQIEKISQSTKDTIFKTLNNTLIQSKNKFNNDFNLDEDASLQRYVSKKNPLNNSGYKPIDLEEINAKYVIIKTTNPYLRKPAKLAFEEMAKGFYNKFNKKLVVVSAYRSFEQQQNLIDNGCSLKQCAIPGTSEHQLGLAVDLHVYIGKQKYSLHQNSVYYRWLDQNAHKYGFHNTYKKGYHIDGQMEEGRHRRYISIPVATYLFENKLTIGEYYKKLKNQKI